MRRFGPLLLTLLVALFALAGCGNDENKVNPHNENEGPYLNLGGLQYQVQISRQLNPNDVEDVAYLEGVPRSLSRLGRNESWFAIFIRIENHEDVPLPAASSFQLRDTQENVFTPVPIAGTNPFAYKPVRVEAKGTLPLASSVAQANESINGQLVLFKVPNLTYDNRPLELVIKDPRDQSRQATVDLDV